MPRERWRPEMSSVWAVISSSGSQPGQTSKELRCYERHSKPYGYEVVAIPMKGVLHLKSVCTALDDHTVLVNPRHFDTAEFSEYRLVAVPADESMAANVLRINGTVCMHAGFHQTADLLRTQGFDIKTVDISEFLKS